MEPSRLQWGFRALLTLAWPVVLSRSAQAVIGFSDALMTAPLGSDALAAATAGSMNALCIAILPMGIVFIVQSYAAQLTGQADAAGARRYGWYGLMLAAVTGVLFVAASGLVEPALSYLRYTPSVRALMGDYIEIRFAAMGAIVGMEAIGNWYGGIGNTRFHMFASIVTMVLNVALNWLLIEGNLGAPALGVQGAAIASVIATWIGFAILLVLFVRRVGVPSTAPTPLRLRELVRMLRFGLPNGLNWFLEFAAFMVFINVTVAELGTVTTAALLAVVQVNSVSFMPAFGLSSAGAILAGQAIGADRKDDVPAIVRRTLVATGTWQVTVGLVYLAIPALVMGLFAPRDSGTDLPEIVKVGTLLLALSAAWQLFDAIVMSVSEAMRAAGDTAFSLWARLLIAWLLFVPGSWLAVGVLGGGAVAAILAIVAYMAVLAGVLALRFRSGAWRKIALTDDPI
jgi:MATE family multidrug resistance protein